MKSIKKLFYQIISSLLPSDVKSKIKLAETLHGNEKLLINDIFDSFMINCKNKYYLQPTKDVIIINNSVINTQKIFDSQFHVIDQRSNSSVINFFDRINSWTVFHKNKPILLFNCSKANFLKEYEYVHSVRKFQFLENERLIIVDDFSNPNEMDLNHMYLNTELPNHFYLYYYVKKIMMLALIHNFCDKKNFKYFYIYPRPDYFKIQNLDHDHDINNQDNYITAFLYHIEEYINDNNLNEMDLNFKQVNKHLDLLTIPTDFKIKKYGLESMRNYKSETITK